MIGSMKVNADKRATISFIIAQPVSGNGKQRVDINIDIVYILNTDKQYDVIESMAIYLNKSSNFKKSSKFGYNIKKNKIWL